MQSWLAAHPTVEVSAAVRRAAWLAEFPQLTAGDHAPLAAIAEDAPWDDWQAIPLRDFFTSTWFRHQSSAFGARYGELRRRWEADR